MVRRCSEPIVSVAPRGAALGGTGRTGKTPSRADEDVMCVTIAVDDSQNGPDDGRRSASGRPGRARAAVAEWTVDHDVSSNGVAVAATRAASDAGSNLSMMTIMPLPHESQRRGPSLPGEAGAAARIVALMSSRQRARFAWRTRFARIPQWRMRTKLLGTTWRRNRRMNSTASRVISFLREASA
jgi:hypothetical protein